LLKIGILEFIALIVMSSWSLYAYNTYADANLFRTYIEERKTIERAIDLPNTPLFAQDNRNIDIGYQFDLLSGGQWVAVFDPGERNEYSRVRSASYPGHEVNTLLLRANIKKLPSIPARGWRQIGSDYLVMFALFLLPYLGLKILLLKIFRQKQAELPVNKHVVELAYLLKDIAPPAAPRPRRPLMAYSSMTMDFRKLPKLSQAFVDFDNKLFAVFSYRYEESNWQPDDGTILAGDFHVAFTYYPEMKDRELIFSEAKYQGFTLPGFGNESCEIISLGGSIRICGTCLTATFQSVSRDYRDMQTGSLSEKYRAVIDKTPEHLLKVVRERKLFYEQASRTALSGGLQELAKFWGKKHKVMHLELLWHEQLRDNFQDPAYLMPSEMIPCQGTMKQDGSWLFARESV
jgi:hypothetical protein